MTPEGPGYAAYVARHERPGDAADLAAARRHVERLTARPRIDVVVPVHDPPEAYLVAAIESALGQLYPDLTLCLHDDASKEPHVARVLAAAAARDPRVRVSRSPENEGIARATNRALALGEGDFVLFLDHDDLLAPHALLVHADAVSRHPDAAIVHSDGDLLDGEGRRTAPIWKPAYDPALLRGFNLVWGLFRRSLLEGLGGMRDGFPGAEDHELSLRAAEAAGAARIRHVPHVLYHWRMVPSSYSHRHFDRCLASSRRAVSEHCARIGLDADVDGAPGAPGFTRVIPRYLPPGGLLIVREGPGDRSPARRDARLRSTTAGLVAFVDARLAPPAGELDGLLAAPFAEPDVVAASPGIDSSDGAIEQRGLLLGVREVAGGPPVARALRGLPRDARAGLGRTELIHGASALGGGVLVVRREAALAAGGFDAALREPLAGELDLCLRLTAAGGRLVVRPDVRFVARGPGELLGEEAWAAVVARHGARAVTDPYYNPNLTDLGTDLALAREPRVELPWRHR